MGDLITNVNYEISNKSDGGVDFRFAENPCIKIQVKTRQGEINKIDWKFNRRELDINTILVCVHTKQNHDSSFLFSLVGFLPSSVILKRIDQAEIKEDDSSAIKLRAENLWHIRGLEKSLRALDQKVWEAIQNESSETLKLRKQSLPNRPEKMLRKFNDILEEAIVCFNTQNFEGAISSCDKALSTFEELVHILSKSLLGTSLNYKTKSGFLRHHGIKEVNFNSEQIYSEIDYRPVLPVYELRGGSRLKLEDFEGAQSDFLLFIVLEEVLKRVYEFPLKKHMSSSVDIGNIPLTATNLSAYYQRGYALFKLSKYYFANRIFDLIISFLTSEEDSAHLNMLSEAYRLKGDMLQSKKEFKEAADFYALAIKNNPELVEVIKIQN